MANKPYERFLSAFEVVLIGALVYLIVVLFLHRRGILSGEQINLISNTLLAVITAAYVILTLGLVSETKQLREQDIQPVFAIDMQEDRVDVKNVGNGPALDTEITLELIPTSDEGAEGKTESSDLDIPAGDSVPFCQEPFSFLGQRLSRGNLPDVKLQLQGTYEDIYGNTKNIRTRTYDLETYRQKDYSYENQ